MAKLAKSVKAYVRAAIEAEKKLPSYKLTPRRKRGYALDFSEAKQSKTRVARIEKCRPKILAGKGFQEQ